jgi:hypothetical protein
MLIDIFKKICHGIRNTWHSRKLKIALLIIVVSNIIELYVMTPSMTKALLIFFSVPLFLFFAGGFSSKKNNLVSYENYDQVDYEEEPQIPVVDRIERTTTTTTKETIYLKNADIKYLDNWRNES